MIKNLNLTMRQIETIRTFKVLNFDEANETVIKNSEELENLMLSR